MAFWSRLAEALFSSGYCPAARDQSNARIARGVRTGEERFQTLLRSVSDVIAILEDDGTVRYVSPAAEHAWGCRPDELLGSNVLDRVHADDRAAAVQRLADVRLRPGETLEGEVRMRYQPDGWRTFAVTVSNLNGDSSVAGIVATYRDITQRKVSEHKLFQLAFSDPLTGLANRAVFMQRLEHALASTERLDPSRTLAVLFIDLDNFKIVNDSLGHAAGDRVLLMVAERLRSCLSENSTIARLGGDEFTVLLEGLSDPSDAVAVAARINTVLSEAISLPDRTVFVGASIGVATSSPGIDRPDDLLRKADVAMYRAKSGGRGRLCVFEASHEADPLARLELETDLHQALERGEFRVYYQPIVSLDRGGIRAAEALVRWQHPRRGLLAPGEFISLAEETGLIVPLGKWVLDEACRQVTEWQRMLYPRTPITIAVNLSARQFQHPDLVADIIGAVRGSGLEPRRLSLEVTESMVMQDMEGTVAKLDMLRRFGIQLAIDDFGTGYSSLSYLKKFNVHTLKIDRSFIAGIDHDHYNSAIVASVIALGVALGIRVTAEGVETRAELDHIQSLGCTNCQGYLFGRPTTAAVFEKLLLSQAASSLALAA